MTSHDALWERIEAFELDETFESKLAREQGWTRLHARRVIREYKRFLYLAVTGAGLTVPSDAVDQAWHLHVCDTRSYLEDLCDRVLGRMLHHLPSRGGAAEWRRHTEGYAETLARYERRFGTPPADIWPAPAARWAHEGRQVRVSRGEVWIVPRLRTLALRAWRLGLGDRIALAAGAGALAFGAVGFGRTASFTPWALGVLLVWGWSAAYHLRRRARGPSPEDRGQPAIAGPPGQSDTTDREAAPADPHVAAWLRGGRDLAVRAAIVTALDAGWLRCSGDRLSAPPEDTSCAAPYRAAEGAPDEPVRPALVRAVVRAVVEDGAQTVAEVVGRVAPTADSMEVDLVERGLVPAPSSARWWALAATCVAPVWGVARILVGASHSRPVGFLALATAIVSLAAWLGYRCWPSITHAGERLGEALAKEADTLAGEGLGATWRYTVGGADTLLGGPLAAAAAALAIAVPAYPRGRSAETSCGGGGCGSGCGGGGCGGCGGCGG